MRLQKASCAAMLQSAGSASAAAVQPGYQAFCPASGLRDGSTIDAVRESRYPILFLHGTGDTFVPYEMTKRAFDACTAPKRLILVDGAEHGKSYVKEPDRVRQELKAFLDTYTPTTKEDTP